MDPLVMGSSSTRNVWGNGPNNVHPIEKSAVSDRATSYRMAPGCAGHEYSFLSSGL